MAPVRWLERQWPAGLSKSPFGRAIAYALGSWAALERYTTDCDLAIDNNAAEPPCGASHSAE